MTPLHQLPYKAANTSNPSVRCVVYKALDVQLLRDRRKSHLTMQAAKAAWSNPQGRKVSHGFPTTLESLQLVIGSGRAGF